MGSKQRLRQNIYHVIYAGRGDKIHCLFIRGYRQDKTEIKGAQVERHENT